MAKVSHDDKPLSPGLRERKKAKTRAAIQEHALRLFQEQGYDATTVEQVAEAAEVSPSTVFRYFPTKEDLVLEDEYDPLIMARLAEVHPEATPIEALREVLVLAFAQVYEQDRDTILTRSRLIIDTPALQARQFEHSLRAQRMFAEGLAARAGRSADDFEVRLVASVLMNATGTAVLYWAERGGHDDLPALIDHAF